MNTPSKLWEIGKFLIGVAQGHIKADLVVRDVKLVNVYTGEIIDGINIAVYRDRIAHVGTKIEHTIGSKTKVINARGLYAVPGFLDGHVHIESSMLLPTEFAKAVLPHGTTSVFADPHEIANVLGVRGIKLMLNISNDLPLRVFIAIPSCVPASSPEFETAGASIEPRDVGRCLRWDRVIGLAEVMNYPGVLACDEKMLDEITITLRAGKVVEGHYASPELDEKLSAYIACGISSCHEAIRRIDALERARRGMWAMVREGSAWRDLHEVIKAVTEYKIDSRRIVLITDDRHVDDIIYEGHMDFVVRRTIEEGVDPIKAIQMATINTAEHYNVDMDLGGIAPGKYADMLIINDLSKIDIKLVIAGGRVVVRDGKLLVSIKRPKIPKWALNTINTNFVGPDDFKIRAPESKDIVDINVAEVIEGKVITKHVIERVKVTNGLVNADAERDLAKVAVIERHHKTGNIGLGFVKGFGFKAGAVASTVAHDSHNLIVVGVNDEDMAFAANELIKIGGGIIVVKNREVLGLVELPVAGLMSLDSADVVASKVKGLQEAWVKVAREMISPFMTLSLLSLSVLPELRITDKGVIDTVNFRRIPLIVS